MSCFIAVFLLVGCAPSDAPAEVVVVEDEADMDNSNDMGHSDDMDEAKNVEVDDPSDSDVVDETGNGERDSAEESLSADVTIAMTGENFKFVVDGKDNPDITVSEGDIVTVEFSSTQGFHDFVIDELDAATAKVREADGVTSVTFLALEAGSYEYYCSVGSHREQGMFGSFIVE